jgi:rhodanese-related sulfurtransferase
MASGYHVPFVGSQEARRRLRCHEVDLVDVRDTSEWIAGHVLGSRPAPRPPPAPRSVHLARNGRTTAVRLRRGNRTAFASLAAPAIRMSSAISGGESPTSALAASISTSAPDDPAGRAESELLSQRQRAVRLGGRRGHSSVGRAPALQAGGRRFDPGWLHRRKACY